MYVCVFVGNSIATSSILQCSVVSYHVVHLAYFDIVQCNTVCNRIAKSSALRCGIVSYNAAHLVSYRSTLYSVVRDR